MVQYNNILICNHLNHFVLVTWHPPTSVLLPVPIAFLYFLFTSSHVNKNQYILLADEINEHVEKDI